MYSKQLSMLCWSYTQADFEYLFNAVLGTDTHEWTSASAFEHLFKRLKKKLAERENCHWFTTWRHDLWYVRVFHHFIIPYGEIIRISFSYRIEESSPLHVCFFSYYVLKRFKIKKFNKCVLLFSSISLISELKFIRGRKQKKYQFIKWIDNCCTY